MDALTSRDSATPGQPGALTAAPSRGHRSRESALGLKPAMVAYTPTGPRDPPRARVWRSTRAARAPARRARGHIVARHLSRHIRHHVRQLRRGAAGAPAGKSRDNLVTPVGSSAPSGPAGLAARAPALRLLLATAPTRSDAPPARIGNATPPQPPPTPHRHRLTLSRREPRCQNAARWHNPAAAR